MAQYNWSKNSSNYDNVFYPKSSLTLYKSSVEIFQLTVACVASRRSALEAGSKVSGEGKGIAPNSTPVTIFYTTPNFRAAKTRISQEPITGSWISSSLIHTGTLAKEARYFVRNDSSTSTRRILPRNKSKITVYLGDIAK